ncbi:MAG: DUF1801 domain-containing protein [Chitinophagaceae bacterium]
MAKNKTVETDASVKTFLQTIKEEKKRDDCTALVKLYGKHTGFQPKMWGNAIIGFGSYHYKYESGREGDAPLLALSPRASSIVLYLYDVASKESLLKKFGKCKVSGGCVHIKKLEDIDTGILMQLMDNSMQHVKKKFPG